MSEARPQLVYLLLERKKKKVKTLLGEFKKEEFGFVQ